MSKHAHTTTKAQIIMADAELEEIRRARLAQLQQQGGGPRGGPSQDGGQEEQKRQAEGKLPPTWNFRSM
ncbi:hypothetical protein VI817_007613 [Penicillium citrinum]|nr:hypothetical protein VI817_007613 [Penicillium citrinum]